MAYESLPIGFTGIWFGLRATIPKGWQEADGTNGTIDMRGFFPRGAQTCEDSCTVAKGTDSHTHSVGTTNSGSCGPSHTHSVTVGSNNTGTPSATVAACSTAGATPASGTHTHTYTCAVTSGTCAPSHCHDIAHTVPTCSSIPVAHKWVIFITYLGH